MDGFFSRFAWTQIDRQSAELDSLKSLGAGPENPPARKTWSMHAGHQRTHTPHRVSSTGQDGKSGPPFGP